MSVSLRVGLMVVFIKTWQSRVEPRPQHQKGNFTKSFLKLAFSLNLIFIFKSSFVVLLEGFFFFLSWQLPSNSSPCSQSLFWATSCVTYITLFNCYWTGSNNLGNRLRRSGPSKSPHCRFWCATSHPPLPLRLWWDGVRQELVIHS